MSKFGTGSVAEDAYNPKENEDEMPQKSQDEHLKRTPNHLEQKLSNLDPDLKSAFEKALADKYNAERSARDNEMQLRKVEQKLNELAQKEQAAEAARLAEQGAFKELAAKHEARVRELEQQMSQRAIREAVSRELVKAGALDEDLLATAIETKYSDVIKSDGGTVVGVSDLVQRLKEEKPLLFKSEQSAAPTAPPQPQAKSTGSPNSNPQPGMQPSSFDALDKKLTIEEVERQYQEATRHLGRSVRGR